MDAAVTVSDANRNALLTLAFSWTVVVPLPANVVIGNVALVAPAGTVTEGGTDADPGRLLPRLTTVPPAGAALDSLTVPVADVPPLTLVGLTVNDESDGAVAPLGLTVSVADRVTPPPVAEIVTAVGAFTVPVVIWKLTPVIPAETATLAGTLATAGLLLVSAKNSSYPADAATFIVPIDPFVVDEGFSVTDVGWRCGCSVTVVCAVAPL